MRVDNEKARRPGQATRFTDLGMVQSPFFPTHSIAQVAGIDNHAWRGQWHIAHDAPLPTYYRASGDVGLCLLRPTTGGKALAFFNLIGYMADGERVVQ